MNNHEVYEVLDSAELARRWSVPVTWIREQTRSRCSDPLPCVRLGKYVRFEWLSPALMKWWAARRTHSSSEGVEGRRKTVVNSA